MAIHKAGVLPNEGDQTGRIFWKEEELIKEIKRNYLLACDAGDTAEEVLEAAFAMFGSNSLGRLKNLEVVQDSEKLEGGYQAWVVRTEYSTDEDVTGGGGGGDGGDPTELDPQTSWSFEKIEEAVREDLNGIPILNTANDPFDPPIVIEKEIAVKTVVVNKDPSEFDPLEEAREYIFTVNEDEYDGWDPGDVKILDISAVEKFWTNFETEEINLYYIVTYKFGYKKGGWQPNVLSQGYNELYDAGTGPGSGKRAIRLPNNGKEYGGSAPLDEDGVALFGADAVDPDKVEFLKFEVLEKKKFADLGVF